MSTARRRSAYRFGLGAETKAALLLRFKGYRILARRFQAGGAEIDIIARRRDVIAFVEVKARPNADEALEAVTPAKARQISRAARVWISRHNPGQETSFRFDAVTVAPGRMPKHIEAAYEMELGF